jgi:glutamate carboxypeptidase
MGNGFQAAMAAGLLATLAAGPASAAASAPRPDKALWAAAQAAQPEALDLLKSIVDIDSGTGDLAGAAKVQAILADRLKALGAEIHVVPTEVADVGDSLVATLTGTGKGRILIIAHVDTVFGPGTVAGRPFSIEGGRAHGPGVGDEKAGDVCALEALTLLHRLGFKNFAKITVLLDASEERGSPGARTLIQSMSKDYDVEFNMEPGHPTAAANTDAIAVWRKGSANIEITVKGRAAHAGMSPQDGRNAAVELIHQLDALNGAFPTTGEGTTVNLTLLQAGERANIIPNLAKATVNTRFRKLADFDGILARVKANAAVTVVPDTTVAVTTDPAFPPFFEDATGDRLAAQAESIYREIGHTLETTGTGGASESALAQSVGTPALDGLGFVGGDFHTDHEWIDLASVAPRIYLTARLIEVLGAAPPGR